MKFSRFVIAVWFGLAASRAGAQPCKNHWDVSIGTPGFDREVASLAVHDDGSGPAVYAGGGFVTADGQTAFRIAKWDGDAWSALGTGIGGGVNDFASSVDALVSVDDGNGPGLFAAGYFARAGVVANAGSIAVWRNGTWSSVGGGIAFADGTFGIVESLLVYDDGLGPALYACGNFQLAGNRPAFSIARWDGEDWSGLGTGLAGSASSMAVYDDGSGPALFVAGRFRDPNTGASAAIAKWNGRSWARIAGGTPSGEWINYRPCPIGPFCPVYIDPTGDALEVFNSGFGESLYLAGEFNRARGLKLQNPAEWDGRRWSNLAGGGLNQRVMDLATHDDGTGEALFAGGFFISAGGEDAKWIAKWDGAQWQGLGSGIDVGPVLTMLSFDDGSGPALYVGGNISSAGGMTTGNIARWKCDE